MVDGICEECRFWDNSITSVDGGGIDGVCRVKSPVADDRSGKGRWPFVCDVDWCGEFAPAPKAGATEKESV